MNIGISNPLLLCTVYLPPNPYLSCFKDMIEYLSATLSTNIPCLICGDFNLPGVCWSTLTGNSSLSNAFCEFVFNWNLTQHITDPTHDIVLTTCNILISDVSISCHNPLIHSDHSIISLNLKCETQLAICMYFTSSVLDYSRADWIGLSDYLMDTDFSTCFGPNDIEFICLTLKNTIHNAIQLFIPKIKVKPNQHPKWLIQKLDIN